MNKKCIYNLSKKAITINLSVGILVTNVYGANNGNCNNQNLMQNTKIIENLNSKNGVSSSNKYLFLENSNKKVKTNTLDTVKETLNNCDKRNWIIGGAVTGVNLLLLLVNFSVNRSHVSQQQLSQRNTESHISYGEDNVEYGYGEVKNNNLIKQKFKDFEIALEDFFKFASDSKTVYTACASAIDVSNSKTYDTKLEYKTQKSSTLWEKYKTKFANVILYWNSFVDVFKIQSGDVSKTVENLKQFTTATINVCELYNIQNLQIVPRSPVNFNYFALHMINILEENNYYNILSKFIDSSRIQYIINKLRSEIGIEKTADIGALLSRTLWTNWLGRPDEKKWKAKIFNKFEINFISPEKSKEPDLSEKDKINKKIEELYQDLESFVGQDIELIKKFIKAFENFKNSSNWSKSAWHDCISTKYISSEEKDPADACFTAFKELENCMNVDSFGVNKNYKDDYYKFYNCVKDCYIEIYKISNEFNYFNLEKENINLNNMRNIKRLVSYMSECLLKFYKNKTKKINNKEISFNNLVYKMNEIGIDIKKINCDFEFNIIRLQ